MQGRHVRIVEDLVAGRAEEKVDYYKEGPSPGVTQCGQASPETCPESWMNHISLRFLHELIRNNRSTKTHTDTHTTFIAQLGKLSIVPILIVLKRSPKARRADIKTALSRLKQKKNTLRNKKKLIDA